MKTYPNIITHFKNLHIVFCVVILSSCEDFVRIDPPVSNLVTATVFNNDASAESAMLGLYYQMATNGYASGDLLSISFLASLSSDDLLNFNVSAYTQELNQFNTNNLIATNSIVAGLWRQQYECIYRANAIIEGVSSSSELSDKMRNQLLGEAKFIRAFNFFYLVNLFGAVPLVLTTDYKINSQIPRTEINVVYQQIINDLLEAQALLKDSPPLQLRLRASYGAATALLARAYLFIQEWEQAEEQANLLIGIGNYALEPSLADVFTTSSSEAIFHLSRDGQNSPEARLYTFTSTPTNAALSNSLLNDFEQSDARRVFWVRGDGVYKYPSKYVNTNQSPVTEHSMVIRMAEVYLIRAEARAERDNVEGALMDLNTIRNRAGLPDHTMTDKSSLIAAIQKERRLELFSEWGHRWLDLKRTNQIGQVLKQIKPEWLDTDALYPIPYVQILNDPGMTNQQNPGY